MAGARLRVAVLLAIFEQQMQGIRSRSQQAGRRTTAEDNLQGVGAPVPCRDQPGASEADLNSTLLDNIVDHRP